MTHPHQDPNALLGQQYPAPRAGGAGSPFEQPSSTQRTEPLAIVALCMAVSGLATGGVSSIAGAAIDNAVSGSTVYRYLHEGIDVLAGAAPSLHGALLAARAAGHAHVNLDGTLIRTDRSQAIGPTAKVDLWWSGKHRHHGGNVQVVRSCDDPSAPMG